MPRGSQRTPAVRAPLSRRAVLGGLAATGLGLSAGCGKDERATPGRPSPSPAPDADAVLTAAVIADKRALLERYRATVERHPTLGGRLAPLRADHLAHLDALDAPPEPSVSAEPTATPPTDGSPAVPAERRAAAAALATAEQDAADRRVSHCTAARDRDLARLLAAVGGCEAAHSFVLTALAESLPASEKPTEKPTANATDRPAAKKTSTPGGPRAGAR